MVESYEFLHAVLDTVPEHIVVIDLEGDIKYSNRSWEQFGMENDVPAQVDWYGVNYLDVCDKAAEQGDDFGIDAGRGIRSVMDDREVEFYMEYPCHGPQTKRWFMMRAIPLLSTGERYIVISHQDITERKLTEEQVYRLSQYDGLTDIPNRRYFDTFLSNEWRRCRRLKLPLSVAILDLDHFKQLNDTYGHPAGDECLKAVGQTLQESFRRPSDLCARYGGEEFAIVLGGVALEEAQSLMQRVLDRIRALDIENEQSPTSPTLTASIGLAGEVPGPARTPDELVERVDAALYGAKSRGRDQLVCDRIDSKG